MSRFDSTDVVIYAMSENGRTKTILVDRDMLLDFVVDQMFPVYNSDWRDPGEPELSCEQFRNQLELPEESIETILHDRGTVDVRLKSGNLFFDHGLTVTINGTGHPLHACIE